MVFAEVVTVVGALLWDEVFVVFTEVLAVDEDSGISEVDSVVDGKAESCTAALFCPA